MKKVILYTALLSIAFIFMSNRGGRTSLSGQGSTTAPGETGQFCGSFGCHSSNTYEADIQLEVTDSDGNLVNQYIPGQDYTVNINIGHIGSPAGYGFQIVSLKDSDESGINNFFDLPAMTQEVMSLNRQYIEQSNRLESENISLNWTAPENGTGDVTFYVSGNAVNGNGSSAGDSGDTTRLTIVEEIMSDVDRVFDSSAISVFPNPAQDYISIQSYEEIEEASIINAKGQVIRQIRTDNEQIKDLIQGVYYIKVVNKKGESSIQQLIKY